MTTLTPAGTGMLPPPKAIKSGHPPLGAVPDGNLMVLVHVTLFPFALAVTVRVVPLKEPLTVGLGGRVPAS